MILTQEQEDEAIAAMSALMPGIPVETIRAQLRRQVYLMSDMNSKQAEQHIEGIVTNAREKYQNQDK